MEGGVEGFERVSVFYPRGVRTGGPEALHQLVDALRSLGHDAALVPLPGTARSPRVAEYERYDAPERAHAARGPRDAVVTPEIWVPRASVTGAATWFCWWLSVDNSPVFLDERRRHTGAEAERTVAAAVRALPRRLGRGLAGPVRRRRLRAAVHLAQSVYARDFVARELAVPVALLSDYVTSSITGSDPPAEAARGTTTPVVAFNPAKGGEVVARVAAAVTTPVEWLPIVAMSPAEVEDALARSDVYLELGHLPGKDRIPREAAVRGAVVLIAARGAGANPDDFPLPAEHRIALGDDLAGRTVRVLTDVLADLPEHRRRQAGFRARLAQERRVFLAEVREGFGPARTAP
ncbi:hypothetical protein ACJ5H2_08170 [Nocardioides sp. R1-1]|uniref:hypothetical protein n=1 Tax=Nocardioides sp. R1-1 TaxID=3383502 RepID=UPI0038CFC9E1